MCACTEALYQYILLNIFNFWYNDMGGAHNPFTRNIINACGIVSFASGAIEIVAAAPLSTVTPMTIQWLAIVGGVVCTTIHIQDLRDQAGDRLRGRQTLPIYIGDKNARWTAVIPVVFWSIFSPFSWRLCLGGYGMTVLTGALIVSRILSLRTAEGDRGTFKIWSLWLISIYSLPFFKMLHTRKDMP